VRISTRLLAQYPEEMTIVLQHQYWDLTVTEHAFEVGLSFNGVPERLLVPFSALKGFLDPSVQFGLQFETVARPESMPAEPVAEVPAPLPEPAAPAPLPPEAEEAREAAKAQIVSLDAFRKK
jgi:hypothetical protein